MSKDGIEEIKSEFEGKVSGGAKTHEEISEQFKGKIIDTLMKRPSLLKAYGGPPIAVPKTKNEPVFLPKNPEENN